MDWGSILERFGFPVAVVAWLLYERSKTMEKFGEAINANTIATVKLTEAISAMANKKK